MGAGFAEPPALSLIREGGGEIVGKRSSFSVSDPELFAADTAEADARVGVPIRKRLILCRFPISRGYEAGNPRPG